MINANMSIRSTSVPVTLTVGPTAVTLAAPGDTEPFRVPFDAAAFGPERASSPGRPGWIEAQGQALWNAAFSGPLGSTLDQAASRAAASGAQVTLRVVAEPDLPTPLHWLPWELLFDSARRDFFALKSGWSVVRSINVTQSSRPFSADRLSVVVVNYPTVDGSQYPTSVTEIDIIQRSVSGRGEVLVVPGPSAPELLSLIGSRPIDILHVIGAGYLDGIQIPFRTHTDKVPETMQSQTPGDFVSGAALAGAMASNGRTTLVTLSACDTETAAEAIASAGVAVLAHRQKIADLHAAALIESFYPAIMSGLPLDIALTEARRFLDRRFPGERAWASAILLTGWPPPALASQQEPAGPQDDVDAASKGAESLARMLHEKNSERIRQLQQIADWSPLQQQVDVSQRRLAEINQERAT